MNITEARPAQPSQKVLVDDAAIMDLPFDQPHPSEGKLIVESFASGPIVVDRSRVKPIA